MVFHGVVHVAVLVQCGMVVVWFGVVWLGSVWWPWYVVMVWHITGVISAGGDLTQ